MTEQILSHKRKYTATLFNVVTGDCVAVHSTLDHSSSSYGFPVWVDDSGISYGQIDLPCSLYEVFDLCDIGPADNGRSNT